MNGVHYGESVMGLYWRRWIGWKSDLLYTVVNKVLMRDMNAVWGLDDGSVTVYNVCSSRVILLLWLVCLSCVLG